MQVTSLAVIGAFVLTPRVHADDRGSFTEWYRFEALTEAVGHRLDLAQANCSQSRRGVVRGIHFADVPPGQAKYVTCVAGQVLDVVVDLRVGSPTFGQVETIPLDDQSRSAVYVAEGLGHAFCALTESATVVYLCSSVFNPTAEHGINPMDSALDLPWLADNTLLGGPALLSDKDLQAPTLAQAQAQHLLPSYAAYLANRERLIAQG